MALSGHFSFMPKPQYLTAERLKELKEELNQLKTSKRKEVAARIEAAKALGDLSENAEYADAKDEQSWVEGKILELEDLILNAQIIKINAQTDYVNVGSTIRAYNGSKEKVFQIVGSNEADPATGKISNESPLGQAFLGKRVGDKVQISVPAGRMIYTVLEIK